MNAQAVPDVRRLMLALDAGRCCTDDVALAVEVAAIIGAEIEGLFVEDSDLMDLARLPFAREVGGRSGQDRPMERASMEMLMRRRVERTVGEMERAGRQRNLSVSHKTARGKVVQQALLQARGRDVLVLNPRAPLPGMSARRTAGPVMVWCEEPDEARSSLEIASELARRLRAELLVGASAARYSTERDVRAELSEWLERIPGRVRVRSVQGTPADALIEMARTARAAQVVLAGGGSLGTEASIERILEALGSRVILVR